MSPIPPEILAAPVDGIGLRPGGLDQQLNAVTPTLLVFLRHFGCGFCKEMVQDVCRASREAAVYPPVLFVYQGHPEDGAAFFGKAWPDTRAIADPDFRLYDAFGVSVASLGQLIGPAVWGCGLRSLVKGHVNGRRAAGDPRRMPGAFLTTQTGAVHWSHPFHHVGDHPDWRTIPGAVTNGAVTVKRQDLR